MWLEACSHCSLGDQEGAEVTQLSANWTNLALEDVPPKWLDVHSVQVEGVEPKTKSILQVCLHI